MKAMVLAAGLGTRLRPLTHETPKPLLPVGGRPILFHVLERLKEAGVEEVVINLHHQGAKIRKALGEAAGLGLRIRYSEEPVLLGTGGGIKKAEPLLGRDPFYIVNGDVLSDVDLKGLASAHRSRRAAATLVLRADPESERYGALTMGPDGRIVDILDRIRGEKGGALPGERRLMFTGIHVADGELLDALPPGRPASVIDAYVEMIRKGGGLFGVVHEGAWEDVGTPERYERALKEWKNPTKFSVRNTGV